MKRIILAGGGNKDQSLVVDKFFLSDIDKNKKILYIPLAMNPEKHPFPSCLEWIKSVFVPLGFDKIEMWTDLNNKTYDELSQFGAIYIGGGNTFRLLSIMKKTNFFVILKKFIDNGGFVYGGSAGALILGRTINATNDENKTGLKDFNGLNILNGFDIKCHYTPDKHKAMTELIQKDKISIIAIAEDAGVFFNGKYFKVITASSPIILFTHSGSKEYLTGIITT